MRCARIVVFTACLAAAVGCTRDDDNGESAPATASPSVAVGAPVIAAPVVTTVVPDNGVSSSAAPTVAQPTTIPDVPETGVPGLDSDDAFCAAWSRFGGSWQVVLVSSAFGDDPTAVAELEVIASTVVADAYEAVLAAWPEELAGEKDTVADGFFGPFQRRSAVAGNALLAAGAVESDIARLAEAWVAALAARDPAVAEIAVDVPSDLQRLVTDAAEAFAAQRVPFQTDPSMVISVETPLTDEYLVRACPDQGSIFGQDVTGG